jgi:hypothetical protein
MKCESEPEYLILCSEYDTNGATEEPGFDSLNDMRCFIISEMNRSVLENIHLLIQYISVAIS